MNRWGVVCRRLETFHQITKSMCSCEVCRMATRCFFTLCSFGISKRCFRSSTHQPWDADAKAFSQNFWKPRGLFLSIPYKDHISRILSHPHFDEVEVIVVTDGERILG